MKTWRTPTIHEALSAVLLCALSAISIHVFFDTVLREECAPSSEDTSVELKRTWEWIDPDTGERDTVTVITVRGVGEGVPTNETAAAWKARHLARVAEAKVVCPPVQGD